MKNTESWSLASDGLGNLYAYCRHYSTTNFQPWLTAISHTYRAVPGLDGFVVKYEELACNTEDTLKKLFDKLDIKFHENSLNHSVHDISLLHEPRGQLSAEQVSKPIDTKSIGRWKKDLDLVTIKKFNSIAQKELEAYGYELL